MRKVIKRGLGRGLGILLAVVIAVSALVPVAEAYTIRVVYRVTYAGSQPTVTVNNQPVVTTVGSTSLLYYGMRGSQVTQLQTDLHKLGYSVTINGIFDYQTLLAVRQFQRDNGLSINGIVDSRVRTALKSKLAAGQPSQPAPVPAPAPAPVPAPAPAPGDSQLAQLSQDERRMVELVNQERTRAGLKPLQVDMQIVKVARLKSQDMITNRYFAHNSPTYGSPFDMMRSFGITYRTAGENLAGAATVDRAHTNLMNSPGHRANILNPNYTHVGIGVVDGGPYGKMFTQMFVGK